VSPLPGLFHALQRHFYQTVAPQGLVNYEKEKTNNNDLHLFTKK